MLYYRHNESQIRGIGTGRRRERRGVVEDQERVALGERGWWGWWGVCV